MTGQLNENKTVDTSIFINGETEAKISDRVKFYGQNVEYITDGKLFLLTTHANWRSRKGAKSMRFLLDNNIQTGTYPLDGTTSFVQEVSYQEHTTRETITYKAEKGRLEITVHPDTQHFSAMFNFTGKSQKGSTLEVEGTFNIYVFTD